MVEEEVQVDLDVMKMMKQMFIHCCIDQVLEIKMHVSMVKMHATVVNMHVTVVIRHVIGKQKLLSSSLFGHGVFQGMKQKNYVCVLYNPKTLSGIYW